MGLPVLLPPGMAKRKPAHGETCNRCGVCCYATLCPLGQHVFSGRQRGPCPALVMKNDESSCGLVENPMAYAPGRTLVKGKEAMSAGAAHLVGTGTGCDCRINGEPKNEAFYRTLEEHDRQTVRLTALSKRAWGVGQ